MMIYWGCHNEREKICTECNKILNKDEVALTQKMLGKDINELYCIDCLAEYIDCDRSDLEIKLKNSRNKVVLCFFRRIANGQD